jgi:hypothetical protein
MIFVAACGGSSAKSSSPGLGNSGSTATTAGGPGTTIHVAKVASDTPSESAKLICTNEAKSDIFNSALGVDTTTPLKPVWDLPTHTYSCVYHYPNNAYMTLSVHEMSSKEETDAYYNKLAQDLGSVSTFNVPGSQGAFQTKNGSAVVRKDYKVLLVDMSHVPASFGVPADTRAHDSANVAFTILGCWTGA